MVVRIIIGFLGFVAAFFVWGWSYFKAKENPKIWAPFAYATANASLTLGAAIIIIYMLHWLGVG